MRRFPIPFWILVYFLIPSDGGAQQVTIRGATPPMVVDNLKARLLPHGYVLESVNDKSALFTLDRGMVSQRGNAAVPVAHIVIELQVRFKQKANGLSVTAMEDVVGERGRPLEFRRPAISDRETVQRMLEAVRAEIEAQSPGNDSAKADTTKP